MVIHLVKSQPPQPGARQSSNSSAGGSTNSNASDGPGRHGGPRYFGRVDGSTLFGSVVIPVIGEAGLNHFISYGSQALLQPCSETSCFNSVIF